MRGYPQFSFSPHSHKSHKHTSVLVGTVLNILAVHKYILVLIFSLYFIPIIQYVKINKQSFIYLFTTVLKA